MGSIRVGTCGYRYYDPGEGWTDEYESKLAAYSDAELAELAGKLREHAESHDRVYCMFNNFEMYDNASALLERLDGG